MQRLKWLLSLFLTLHLQQNCFSQYENYEKESIKVGYVKRKIGKGMIETKSKKLIRIFVYKSFNDTLLFKLNDSIVFKTPFNTDTINNSSNYSGICVNLKITKRKNNISIYLVNEKKYVSFILIHKRRFYKLHRTLYTVNNLSQYEWNINGTFRWF